MIVISDNPVLAKESESSFARRNFKEFLDQKVSQFNNISFIEKDPISIPHNFSSKEDIEISGFLTSMISWGRREIILRNAGSMLQLMENEPHKFLLQASNKDFTKFSRFVHRTFNGTDCIYFLKSLQTIYRSQSSLEIIFNDLLNSNDNDFKNAMSGFRKIIFGKITPGRSAKHLPDPESGSAAKRMCMYLRWMIRRDKAGVDFGIWKSISPSLLYCPLDIHSGRVARELGLLGRAQNDWKAVDELTQNLRIFDKEDPVKYDFALFGLGISQELRVWL